LFIKGRFTRSLLCPCHSPAMLCHYGFRMCLSHLIHTVRPCQIHTWHAMPMPCSDHAVLLKAMAQHVCREMACGLPARIWLLLATMWSSMKVVTRTIPISDVGGECETKHHSSWTRKRVVAAHYQKKKMIF